MFRFILLCGFVLMLNIMISYIIRKVLSKTYIDFTGNSFEHAKLQLSHLKICASDRLSIIGMISIAATMYTLFVTGQLYDTDALFSGVFVGITALLNLVYITKLVTRTLPGSIPRD